MSEFDVLFGLVLRLEDSDGTNIWRKCDNGEISRKIGELIKQEYPNFMVYPIVFEEVEEDKKCRVTNQIMQRGCDDL